MGKFFNIVLVFIVLLLLTAFILVYIHGNTHLIFAKEYIWLLMTANFAWMYKKRNTAQALFEAGDLAKAKASISLIPKLLLPLNIILGLVALYLGLILRGL